MERLYKLIIYCSVSMLWLGGGQLLAAPTYCSLTVNVVAPDGRRMEVPIEVIEKGGRKVHKQQNLASQAVRFCDLGIQPVTVIVGIGGCNQVQIEDVPVAWKQPYTLKVTYDPQPCLKDRVRSPAPYCEVLLRVTDQQGKWISDAIVSFDEPKRQQLKTDSAGRAFELVKLHGTLNGSARAEGFGARKFSITCSEIENRDEVMQLPQLK